MGEGEDRRKFLRSIFFFNVNIFMFRSVPNVRVCNSDALYINQR